jgi:hypothetical protein
VGTAIVNEIENQFKRQIAILQLQKENLVEQVR